MKKMCKIMLIVVLCISVSLTTYANDTVDVNSIDILRGIVCECGGNLLNSNKTISIFVSQREIPCGSVYGTPNWGTDLIRTYDIYSTYVCNSCGNVIPRNYIGQQDKYFCVEGNTYYNPETGQSIDPTIENIDYAYKDIDKKEHEINPQSIPCECGGILLPSENLILSNSYTVVNYKNCKKFPYMLSYRDEIWRYYFYNTYICNNCNEKFARSKTQFYEDWGFCSHGAGKYLINVVDNVPIL